MIVRRRTWFYRLAGENFAHAITFKIPMTAQKVRETLRHTVGRPIEIWGRSAYA
jgi:GGDEF domain-containing protein